MDDMREEEREPSMRRELEGVSGGSGVDAALLLAAGGERAEAAAAAGGAGPDDADADADADVGDSAAMLCATAVARFSARRR
jgi:hypothetical protein